MTPASFQPQSETHVAQNENHIAYMEISNVDEFNSNAVLTEWLKQYQVVESQPSEVNWFLGK